MCKLFLGLPTNTKENAQNIFNHTFSDVKKCAKNFNLTLSDAIKTNIRLISQNCLNSCIYKEQYFETFYQLI